MTDTVPLRQALIGVACLWIAFLFAWFPFASIWSFIVAGDVCIADMFGLPGGPGSVSVVGLVLLWICIRRGRWSGWASFVAAALLLGAVGLMAVSNALPDESEWVTCDFMWESYIPLAAVAALQIWSGVSKLRAI